MNSLPEYLPPRWRENMQQRRACLLHFDAERPLSHTQATDLAVELTESAGEGKWECTVRQLDTTGREWEFRFKPHIDRVRRPKLRSMPD